MSRWLTQFESHPFQLIWKKLTEIIHSIKIDDVTTITSVEELARLKKVLSYVDEMLKGLDPELVPASTWDSFLEQTQQCSQNMVNYTNGRDVGYIRNANSNADNLLSYVRPYMVSSEKVARAVQNSFKEYNNTIKTFGESYRQNADTRSREINQIKDRITQLFESISISKKTIDEFYEVLFGTNNNSLNIQNEIIKLLAEFKEEYKLIHGYYEELLIGDSNKASLKREIIEAKEFILNEKGTIESALASVTKQKNELELFHTKIFGRPADLTNIAIEGLDRYLTGQMNAISQFETTQKLKYTALNTQIETLLPGATSAGLATAYKDMAKSFEVPIKKATNLFYGCIFFLTTFAVLSSIHFGFWYISIEKLGDWPDVLKGLVFKAPFYAPIIWLALYATKRRSEYQRLQQEYAHKEALAKSYKSYKDQLADLGDTDQIMQKEFIKKAIDAITLNASQTLDGKHGDKLPAQEILDKVLDEMKNSKTYIDKILELVKSKP